MNIFCTDLDPEVAARNLCDVHVRKMLVETAQMLCTSARAMGEPNGPYDDVQRTHKCNRWIQESRANWDWTVRHGMAINSQYMRRNKKGHKAFSAIVWASRQNPPLTVFKDHSGDLTPFADAVWPPLVARYTAVEDAIDVYRAYYARKEQAWAILARAQALARVAAGRSCSPGLRPLMVWSEPSSRPLWMPERVPDWSPTPFARGEAESYGHGRRIEMDFPSIKKMPIDHRKFFVDLAAQDYEDVDLDVAKELIKIAS